MWPFSKASSPFWQWARQLHRHQILEKKRTALLLCKGYRTVVKSQEHSKEWKGGLKLSKLLQNGDRKSHWKPGETFCELAFHKHFLTLLMFTSSTMLPSPGWSFTLNICCVCNLGMFTATRPAIGLELTTSKIDSTSRYHCWALFTKWRGRKKREFEMMFIYLLVNMIFH